MKKECIKLAESYALELNNFLENKNQAPKEFLNSAFRKYVCPVAIEPKFGGIGGNFSDIYIFNKITAEKTGNTGAALTGLISQIVLKIIDRYGSENLKKNIFTQALEKGTIFSFAVSEPKTGPHPKHMKTTALKKNNKYILKGIKTFITNGPVCDYSLVTAITREDKKKYYSILIAPSNHPDITSEHIENLPFFKDSFHGTLNFDSAALDSSALLGEEDKAYEKIVMKFRKYEDILMAGTVLGACSNLFNSVTSKLNTAELEKNIFYESGSIKVLLKTLDFLSLKACEELENENEITDYLHIFFRMEADTLVDKIKNLCNENSASLDSKEKEILNDLENAGKIAFKAYFNKTIKIGENKFFNV